MTNFVEKLFSCLKPKQNTENLNQSLNERGTTDAQSIGTNDFDVQSERLKKQVAKADPAAKSIRTRPSSTHMKLQALSASGVGGLSNLPDELQSAHLTGFLDKLEA